MFFLSYFHVLYRNPHFKGQKTNALPKISSGGRINSGRSSVSSAKQVYLSKARYMPGLICHNTVRAVNKENQRALYTEFLFPADIS